jgi:two-component system NtrC family sensor kinase
VAASQPQWGLEDMGQILEVLFAQSSLGISFHDRDLRAVYLNKTLAAVGGRPVSAYLGRPLTETLPAIGAKAEPHMRYVLSSGRRLVGMRFAIRDRQWIASYYPARRLDGDLLGVGVVMYDDTARIEAERRLHESEERYRTLVELSPDGIAMIEAERVSYVNPAGVAILGAGDASEVVGQSPWDFAPLGRATHPEGFLAALIADNAGHAYDAKARRVDGSEITLSVRSIQVVRGGVPAFLSVFCDVSAQRLAQEELRRTHEQLETRVAERTASLAEANERLRHEATERESAERQLRIAERLASIGTLAAGVAHEINNPLAAVVATAELARAIHGDGEWHDEVAAALARIIEEAHRAGEIVKSLLRFGRSDQTDRWPIDVGDVVRRLAASSRIRTVLDSCRLRMRLARRTARIVMNPAELEQIVLNLVQNAVQAGASEVALQTAVANGHVRIVVRDDGRGIAARDRERIFDPFFTTRVHDGGTGLGLSIVHGIVTRYEGRIEVQSRVGRGTSFTVQLPSSARRARAS